MTDDDALRARLRAADPAPPAVPPLTHDRLERAMTTIPSQDAAPRRRLALAAAAVAVLGGAGAASVALLGDDDPSPSGGSLELALPGGDPLAMSCIPVEARFLRDMPVAFAGTATAVADGEVRLDVTRWYTGGDAGTVVLRTGPDVQQLLLGATDFRVGEDYLVSATDGTVSVCGYTGPASAELQAVYDEAY